VNTGSPSTGAVKAEAPPAPAPAPAAPVGKGAVKRPPPEPAPARPSPVESSDRRGDGREEQGGLQKRSRPLESEGPTASSSRSSVGRDERRDDRERDRDLHDDRGREHGRNVRCFTGGVTHVNAVVVVCVSSDFSRDRREDDRGRDASRNRDGDRTPRDRESETTLRPVVRLSSQTNGPPAPAAPSRHSVVMPTAHSPAEFGDRGTHNPSGTDGGAGSGRRLKR
jgi:hypothetical protein